MKEVSKMRLGLLREIKKLKAFLNQMERDVKSRQENKIYPAYVFIKALAFHISEGDLNELSLDLHQELLHRDYLERDPILGTPTEPVHMESLGK